MQWVNLERHINLTISINISLAYVNKERYTRQKHISEQDVHKSVKLN